MPNIYKMSNAGGFKSLTRYQDMLAGNTVWNPWSPEGAFDALATVTLSSTSSSISFSGIPNSYRHLQIRGIVLSATEPRMYLRYNGDSSSNYTYHHVYGYGTGVEAIGSANTTENWLFQNGMSNATNVPNTFVIDLLDYKDTNKFKTMRSLNGFEESGYGSVFSTSGLWQNTSAISAIEIFPGVGTFAANSSFALYGVK